MVVQDRRVVQYWETTIAPALKVADDVFLERLLKSESYSFDHRRLPQPFERPTLIITGRQDPNVGYRDQMEIIENYPRASFVVLDCCGHGPEHDQEALYRALVNEWLDRVEADTLQN